MYNPQLSRREFLRGTAGTAGAIEAAGLYDKAIVAAGAVGGLVGILGGTAHASHSDIRGLGSFRKYLAESFKPVEDRIRREKKERKGAVGWSPVHIFSGYIDGNLVFVYAGGYPDRPPTAEMKVSKWDRQSDSLLWEYEFSDRGVKGILGPSDVIVNKDFKGNLEEWVRISSGNHLQAHKRLIKNPNKGKEIGQLVFNPPTIYADGVYAGSTLGQVALEVYERRKKANELYRRTLPEVIARLEKLGRFKVE